MPIDTARVVDGCMKVKINDLKVVKIDRDFVRRKRVHVLMPDGETLRLYEGDLIALTIDVRITPAL